MLSNQGGAAAAQRALFAARMLSNQGGVTAAQRVLFPARMLSNQSGEAAQLNGRFCMASRTG
jgi:hypothetical protein